MKEKSNIIKLIRKNLKESGLTAKEALILLNKCKSELLNEMPIDKNLGDKLTW